MPSKKKLNAFMPKIRPSPKRYQCKNGQIKTYRYYVCDYAEGSKRIKRSFRTKEAAEKWAKEFAELRAHSSLVLNISSDQVGDALRAYELRDESERPDLTLERAMRIAIQAAPAEPERIHTPLPHAGERYIEQARIDGLRERSIRDLHNRLKRFADSFSSATVGEAAAEADGWIKRLTGTKGEHYHPLTIRHFRVILSGFFNWCIDENMLSENPVRGARSRRGKQLSVDEKEPGILTSDQVSALLSKAETDVPSMVPALCVALFCGVRTTELLQLMWSDVNLDESVLRISGRVAKRRSVRAVDIQSNLTEWLFAYRRPVGPIFPDRAAWRFQFDKVRKEAGLLKDWPHNAMRHTFASYHLQMFGNANLTALQLGHKDIAMLDNHYKGLTTKSEAKSFWGIRPGRRASVIPFPAAGGR